jgi:hypothetical protein
MKEKDAGVKWFNTIFYPQNKSARAVFLEDKILNRLRQKDVILFTPWGPRYDWAIRGSIIKSDDKEIKVLHFLSLILKQFKKNMPDKKISWIFLGADIYGTKVNNLPSKIVGEYFSSLEQKVLELIPEAQFYLWSEFDEQAEEYRSLIRKNFYNFVSPDLLKSAIRTARAMRRGSDPKDYLIERLAEAMFIEKKFEPIKISCVNRYKDDGVDWELPRLYFLSQDLHAPWM